MLQSFCRVENTIEKCVEGLEQGLLYKEKCFPAKKDTKLLVGMES